MYISTDTDQAVTVILYVGICSLLAPSLGPIVQSILRLAVCDRWKVRPWVQAVGLQSFYKISNVESYVLFGLFMVQSEGPFSQETGSIMCV